MRSTHRESEMSSRRDNDIVAHYAIGGLKDRILDGVKRTGVDLPALRPVDLAPVDEFHMGGRAATADVIKLMRLRRTRWCWISAAGLAALRVTWHRSANAAPRASISHPSTSNSPIS